MLGDASLARQAQTSLGSASAGAWRWAMNSGGADCAWRASATERTAHQVLRVPREVLHMMSAAAWAAGRSEEEIWIEAAREWLRRRAHEDDPPPTAPAAAWPASPRVERTWAAIDALVAELRPTVATISPGAGSAA
jgi:hypothetical protein